MSRKQKDKNQTKSSQKNASPFIIGRKEILKARLNIVNGRKSSPPLNKSLLSKEEEETEANKEQKELTDNKEIACK